MTGETPRAKNLRLLLRMKYATTFPWDYYVCLIKRDYDRLLLPYNIGGDHFIVFDLRWGEDGGLIKVWDGMNKLGKYADPSQRAEVQTLMDVFFGGERVPVLVREEGDPIQDKGCGCGPFAFLVMCYLASDRRPDGWTGDDEGVARNYLGGCVFRGQILPLPKRKFR